MATLSLNIDFSANPTDNDVLALSHLLYHVRVKRSELTAKWANVFDRLGDKAPEVVMYKKEIGGRVSFYSEMIHKQHLATDFSRKLLAKFWPTFGEYLPIIQHISRRYGYPIPHVYSDDYLSHWEFAIKESWRRSHINQNTYDALQDCLIPYIKGLMPVFTPGQEVVLNQRVFIYPSQQIEKKIIELGRTIGDKVVIIEPIPNIKDDKHTTKYWGLHPKGYVIINLGTFKMLNEDARYELPN